MKKHKYFCESCGCWIPSPLIIGIRFFGGYICFKCYKMLLTASFLDDRFFS